MRSVAKPALAAVIALLAVVVLAACGSSSSSTSASGGSSASSGSSSSASSGSSGSSQPGKGKPPIVLGDKNFTEEFILGDLYQQALQAKGYTVTLKANIGSSELTDKALTSGQIQMYPEYTGVILSVIKGQSKVPVSAAATYAQKNHLVSMEDLAKLPSWTNGGPPENKTRYEGLVGMHEAYHLNNVKFVPLAIGLQYQALDSGKVDTAQGFT